MAEVIAALAASVSVLLALTARAGDPLLHRLRLRRHEPPAPPGRPLEDIAADLRRISARFHQDGLRFAKYEGYRRSYDGVLAEAADTLEVAHLVRVLAAGEELDRERERLEDLMTELGVLPWRV